MGFFRFRGRWIVCTLALTGGLGPVWAASAQSMASTPSQISEAEGATTGLGTSHRFASQAAAASHCPGDTVVWHSGPNLVYALPTSPDYGKGKGFYACKLEADDAGFQRGG